MSYLVLSEFSRNRAGWFLLKKKNRGICNALRTNHTRVLFDVVCSSFYSLPGKIQFNFFKFREECPRYAKDFWTIV